MLYHLRLFPMETRADFDVRELAGQMAEQAASAQVPPVIQATLKGGRSMTHVQEEAIHQSASVMILWCICWVREWSQSQSAS